MEGSTKGNIFLDYYVDRLFIGKSMFQPNQWAARPNVWTTKADAGAF